MMLTKEKCDQTAPSIVLKICKAITTVLLISKFSWQWPDLSLNDVMTLSFRTDRPGHTVQTQIRLLLEEQSDQGLHCLLFHLHHLTKCPKVCLSLFEF